MPDPLFADLYRDTERLNWDPTDEVRARARRRTRRTRVAGGLACALAVAAVATGAAAVAGGPDAGPPLPPATNVPTPSVPPGPTADATPSPGTPTTTPSGTPLTTRTGTSAAVPPAALLRIGDLPAGYRRAGDDLDGDWSLDAAAALRCANGVPPLTVRHRAERGVVFRADGDQVIIERVRRYTDADAETAMDRFTRLVTGCRPEFSIWERDFVGDGSLLVGLETEGVWSTWLVLRQGDLVAEVWLGKRKDLEGAKVLADRAAERLCAGTDAC
ncbi:hypothetical protein ACN26Y_08160 [Micromonospora sp. WMMD558]|uniref:hypothetical protein n=1 Tax=Micromonospora sp. WMMD558 TaxID=3403462 RepID=UPI003BF5B40C